jgi:basic amino acid/polyamine antiporter, APA family
LAEEYASSIARNGGGSLTVCCVAPLNATEDSILNANERLNQAIERVTKGNKIDIHAKLIRNNSVIVGVLRESDSYDGVVVGAAGKSIYPRILFGSIPESIAKRSKNTVIMVKHYHPVKALLGRVFGE